MGRKKNADGTKERRIVWDDSHWETLIAAAYKICERQGTLPLTRGRFPFIALFKEAQQALPAEKHRTVQAVQPKDRLRMISGVNELNAAANKSIHKVTLSEIRERGPELIPVRAAPSEPAADEARRKEALNRIDARHKLFTDAVAAPPKQIEPHVPGFFEAMGCALDGYVKSQLQSAVAELLPKLVQEVVSSTVDRSVANAVAFAIDAYVPKATLTPDDLTNATTSIMNDMVGVLDEVKQLRELLERKADKPEPQPQKFTQIERLPVLSDSRPLIVVTGAYSVQATELKKHYSGNLRLQVYFDTCPAGDLSAASVVYVFEKHVTKGQIDKLREKVGRDKVVTVPGGLTAIKRKLDTHVNEVRQAARSGLAHIIGLSE